MRKQGPVGVNRGKHEIQHLVDPVVLCKILPALVAQQVLQTTSDAATSVRSKMSMNFCRAPLHLVTASEQEGVLESHRQLRAGKAGVV